MNEEQINQMMQELQSNTSWANIEYTQIETQAQSIDPVMMDTLAAVWMAVNGLSLIMYLTVAIGLYLINKKLWEKYPWVSFIPVVQIYSYFSASKKSWLHYLVFPILAIVVWAFLAIFTFGISLIIAYIYALVMWIKLIHAISVRTGRWVWTTIWFILIPFIMYPLVWYKMNENKTSNENKEVENNNEL